MRLSRLYDAIFWSRHSLMKINVKHLSFIRLSVVRLFSWLKSLPSLSLTDAFILRIAFVLAGGQLFFSKMSKRKSLSISFKVDVIRAAEEMPLVSQKGLAQRFELPESTLKGILKNKIAIMKSWEDYGSYSAKRSRVQSGKYDKLESALVSRNVSS